MKIAILDDYQDCIRRLPSFSLLEGHEVKVFTNSARGLGQLSIRLAPFEALVLQGTRTMLTRQLIAKLPNLKLVAVVGAEAGDQGRDGCFPVDQEAAAARGIRVLAGGADPAAAAELTLALILAARRRLVAYAANLQQGLWQASSFDPARNRLGTTVAGSILGIWGYGRVGSLVAAYGKALQMRVLVWGSDTSRARALADGCHAAASQAELFADADVVSLHLPLLDSTRGCVTAADFARMRDDALFVNTSHAALVEPGALLAALERGRPAQAALDVFDTEPLTPDSPWLRMENVLATPHLGNHESGTLERQFRAAFEAILNAAGNTG